MDHDVEGEHGDLGRSDNASNRQRGAQLITRLLEFAAEPRPWVPWP